MGRWLGLAPATLEFWVRFPNERNQGLQAHPVLVEVPGSFTGPIATLLTNKTRTYFQATAASGRGVTLYSMVTYIGAADSGGPNMLGFLSPFPPFFR